MQNADLSAAIATVPPGQWAVGVSGGADSVGLLMLLHERSDLELHVVHLNHQTRGRENDDDARFVDELSRRLNVSCTIALLCEVEATMESRPANPSARYRAARRHLFTEVVRDRNLNGVILAHHADDQAETILHRLIRSSGPAGLCGMEARSRAGELVIVRPLLTVSRSAVRENLAAIGQTWREDSSNASDKYLRNRLRKLLASPSQMTPELLTLGRACGKLRDWVREAAPTLERTFPTTTLASLPQILAAESARRWLVAQGAMRDKITPDVLDRLIKMAADAGTPPRGEFPGRLQVRRRAGMIFADKR